MYTANNNNIHSYKYTAVCRVLRACALLMIFGQGARLWAVEEVKGVCTRAIYIPRKKRARAVLGQTGLGRFTVKITNNNIINDRKASVITYKNILYNNI